MSRARQGSGDGFTLIEMMVALAIFSLAALTLVRLQGATARQTLDLETRTLGQIVANNLAVEAMTDPVAPTLGKSEGQVDNGGRMWRWTRVTTRTADARIVRIDIAVTDDAGRKGGVLSLARTVE